MLSDAFVIIFTLHNTARKQQIFLDHLECSSGLHDSYYLVEESVPLVFRDTEANAFDVPIKV